MHFVASDIIKNGCGGQTEALMSNTSFRCLSNIDQVNWYQHSFQTKCKIVRLANDAVSTGKWSTVSISKPENVFYKCNYITSFVFAFSNRSLTSVSAKEDLFVRLCKIVQSCRKISIRYLSLDGSSGLVTGVALAKRAASAAAASSFLRLSSSSLSCSRRFNSFNSNCIERTRRNYIETATDLHI